MNNLPNPYQIIKECGIGVRKKVYLGINTITNENVYVFVPTVTTHCNDIEIVNQKFKNDIEVLNKTYSLHHDKCNIIPLFTCKHNLIIVTKYINKNSTLYKYLSDD